MRLEVDVISIDVDTIFEKVVKDKELIDEEENVNLIIIINNERDNNNSK